MALRRVDALRTKQSISALYPSIRLCHTQDDSLYQIKSEYDRISESVFEQKETSAMFLNIQVKKFTRRKLANKRSFFHRFSWVWKRSRHVYIYADMYVGFIAPFILIFLNFMLDATVIRFNCNHNSIGKFIRNQINYLMPVCQFLLLTFKKMQAMIRSILYVVSSENHTACSDRRTVPN